LKKLLSEYPELLREWHTTKNGELKPNEVTYGSNKKVWWLCPKDHSYDTAIKNRTSKKPDGCPYCSGRRVSEDNNILSLFPKVADEWHPTKNGELKPDEVTHASHKKVWWLCPKGHPYDAVIASRTGKNPSGCPYCTGQKVGEDNNLNHLFPKIASEWHPTKNGDLKPDEVTYGSRKKVWWKCHKGHDYDTEIKSRTRKDKSRGCPYCSSNKVSEDNNLLSLFPKVADEWHPTKNGGLKPEDFTSGSGKKVWWLCQEGHSYDAIIVSRTRKKPTDCPYCSGRKVSEDNNLEFLFPEISSEWHPTKNGELKPSEVTYGSHKKVWWKCPKGHSFDAIIKSRTKKKPTDCPYCSNQSSSPELRILAEFRFIFHNVKTRHKIEGVEIDVYVPKLNLAIEYDGSYFHQGKEQKDLEKNEFLKSRNIEVIRVRCSPLTKITENDLIVENDNLSKSDLNRVFKRIYSFADSDIKEKIKKYFDSDHFLNENLFREYLSYFPSPLPEHSLSTNFPNLISEWDFDKNDPLIPDHFTYASNKKVWWLCPKDHSYDSRIYDRTSNKPHGCPYCTGQKVSDENNLLSLFPKVADEWHPTKNGELKPDEVTYGSKKKVWWLCPKDHSYDSVIKERTKKKPTDCPYCSGRKVSEDNNLEFLFPEISSEWHPTKNGELKPSEVTYGSGKKVWWLCQEGHSFENTISHRTSKKPSGCPHCYRNSS